MMQETKLFSTTDIGSLTVDSSATITFYKGKPPIDYLQAKVNAIVDCNPWLEGKIIRKKKDLYMVHSIKPAYKSFLVVNRPNLKHEMSDHDLIAVDLEEFRIKKGNAMINSSELMFRIVVIVISDDLFGLYMSISHGISDGTTRYRIYGMLDPDITPVALISHRDDEFERLVDESHEADMKWGASAGFVMNIISAAIFGKKHQSIMRYINPDYVEKMKKQYNTANSFVSTNDALTSGLSNVVDCDYSILAINHRGLKTFEKYTSDYAGNYVGILALHKDDYKSPLDVRASVSALSRVKSGSLPGLWTTVGLNLLFFSNWTKIYQNVAFQGCEQQLHMPIPPVRDFVLPSALVIFTPKQGEVAMMLIHRNLPVILSRPELNRITKIL